MAFEDEDDAEGTDLGVRVAALEERIRRLEARQAAASDVAPAPREAPANEQTSYDERFWALRELKARVPETGAVLFTGTVVLPTGEYYEWQQAGEAASLLDEDWSACGEKLAALAHSVRLTLLQRILNGARTAGELASTESVGTTGQLYHHLRQLVSAGWLRSTARGRYEVPGHRVIPLLAVLEAVRR